MSKLDEAKMPRLKDKLLAKAVVPPALAKKKPSKVEKLLGRRKK